MFHRAKEHADVQAKVKLCRASLEVSVMNARRAVERAIAALTVEADRALEAYRDVCVDRVKVGGAWFTAMAKGDGIDAAAIESLHSLMQKLPLGSSPVSTPSALKCEAELQALADSAREKASILDLDTMLAAFKTAFGVIQEFHKSIGKAGSDINSYMETKVRNCKRDIEKARKERERKAVDEAKAKGKEAAEKIKQSEKAHGLIFHINSNNFGAVPQLSFAAFEASPPDCDKPWLIRGGGPVLEWREEPRVVMTMTEFGSGYKKMQSCKDSGKAQAPLMPRAGKEETDEVFNAIFPALQMLDVTAIAGGAGFMNNTWKFGYATDYCKATTAPNAAAMLKVFMQGEVTFICFPLRGLADALGAATLEEVSRDLLMVSEAKLEPLLKKIPGYITTCKPDDVLFIPMGWMLCEKVSAGTLIYGCRKSYVVKTAANKDNYTAMIELMRSDKRDVSRMENVLALMP